MGQYSKKQNKLIDILLKIKEQCSEKNWNGYECNPIPILVIERSFHIVYLLSDEYLPGFIAPTASESVLFEYDKRDNMYICFDIFKNHIEGYVKTNIIENENLLGFTHLDIKNYLIKFGFAT